MPQAQPALDKNRQVSDRGERYEADQKSHEIPSASMV